MAAGRADLAGFSRQPPALSKGTAALAACPRPAPGLSPTGLAPRAPGRQSEADIIASAVRAGKASELPRLLDAALSRSLATAAHQDVPTSAQEVATPLLHSALRACAAARCFNEVIAAYDHMAEHVAEGNSGIWSVLLYSIVEAGTFCRCKQVFENLCKMTSPSAHDFVNMVRCYAGQEDAVGLREMLANLRSSGESVDTYTWNRALASCSHSEHALELAESLAVAGICAEGLDAVGYNTLMKYNARAGQLSRCFELRAEMLEKGLEASEVTFGILLDVCVGAQELDFARKVFDDLCASGLQLNVVHCTTFIKGLVGAGKLDEAAGVLQEMVHSAGVKPDLITYSTIVKAYADAGDVASALKMLSKMLEEGVRPDEIIYNSVLTGCCVFPVKSAHVMRTFETLIGLGLKPTTTTLSILLKALAHTQSWPASLQVLKDAPKNFRLQPEMRLYAQLARACVKARSFDVVPQVFNAMVDAAACRREKVDPAVAGRVLRSCLLGGATDMAAELREAARQAGIAVDPTVEKMLKTALLKKARA